MLKRTHYRNFGLEPEVLMALIGGTTTGIVGIFLIVSGISSRGADQVALWDKVSGLSAAMLFLVPVQRLQSSMLCRPCAFK